MAGHELVGGEAVHHPRRAGEEAEQVDAHADLVDGGTDRLAGVGALEPPELVGPSLERIGQLEQQQRAILRRRLLPGLEGGRGRPDGAIHVLGRAGRDDPDGLVVGGVDDVRRPAVGGIHELATDELLVGLDALEGVGHWGASWVIHRSAGSSAVHRSAGRSGVPPRAPSDRRPSSSAGTGGSGQRTGWPVSATRSMRSAARTVPDDDLIRADMTANRAASGPSARSSSMASVSSSSWKS